LRVLDAWKYEHSWVLEMLADGSVLLISSKAKLSIVTLCIYHEHINPLKTKRRPLYLKTQSVPRC